MDNARETELKNKLAKGLELTLKLTNILKEVGSDERIPEFVRQKYALKLLNIVLEG